MSRQPKRYWRSLGQLADDPRARAFLDREFPEGASDPPDEVSRRTMLKLVGASLSLAGLAGCRRPAEKIVPYVTAPEEILPGMPLHFATTLPWGGGAYGLVVESHEGRPTKIEGNELHPATRGSSSIWMQAGILDLYDPDRSQGVRDREGNREWADYVAAWKQLEEGFRSRGGQGLAVLTEPFSSPTMERLASSFRSRFPNATWAVYDPVGDDQVRAGVSLVAGSGVRPVQHLDRARVILCLDSDPLMTDRENVRHARGFSEGRQPDAADVSRLYVVESAMSITGANADHRLRLRASRIAAFVGKLAEELAAQGLSLRLPSGSFPAAEGIDPAWVRAVARDLAGQRGQGLVMAGEGQPAAVHAAVHAINDALGNVGRTVTLHESKPIGASDTNGLGVLVTAMRRGEVSALVVLGGNPVYDAPADLDLAAAMAEVEHTVHLSTHHDETSGAAGWHLPRTHFLESWGDARAVDGTLGVVQPLIAPLFEGRSELELLALLTTGEEHSAYDLVRETWSGWLGQADFEKRWQQVLYSGLLLDHQANRTERRPGRTGAEPERRAFDALRRLTASPADGLELVYRPSATLFDGRWANNGWLQELPDPITKITWDNAALLSPATAERLGVEAEQLIRVSRGERELELPAWIVPGQADDSIVLQLGYGRTAAGRVGNGVGVDTYALRTSDAMGFAGGAKAQATAGRRALAETQHHDEMDALGEGELADRVPVLVREATFAENREHPDWVQERGPEHPPLESLWHEHSYDHGYQWGMVIDLNTCIGCNACTIACQSENNIPVVGRDQVARGREMHWIRVDRYFSGSPADPQAVFQPIPCMHCENAPCEQVCPVAATVHDSEGLNTMVYNRCIGTRYCANNCPYKVRRFNFYNFTKDTPEIQRLAANPNVTVRSRGVMEKCTYCLQRINAARTKAKLEEREVRDGDVTTACEQACPTRAITFGNIRDESSRVAQAKHEARNYVLLAELNDKPRTSYKGKLRNPNPELEQA